MPAADDSVLQCVCTVYMDTMHAAVDETNFYLHTCCTAAPKGTSKAYLHPMSLITSAQALLAGERATSGEAKQRIIKVSMSVLYPILWNWDEVTCFAHAESIEWASVMVPQTKQHGSGLLSCTTAQGACSTTTRGTKGVSAGAPLHGCMPISLTAPVWIVVCALSEHCIATRD